MEKERKLIYADSLIEAEKRVLFIGTRGGKTKALLVSMIDRLIKDAPAVDAVEAVHGLWLWEGPFKACSECGSHVEWNETLGASFWHFCPFCGAKMDGTK